MTQLNYATPTLYKNSEKHQAMRAEPLTKLAALTKPNESLSIEEMFKKFSRNEPISATQREPIYNPDANHDDEDFEKLATADPIDKDEYAGRLAEDMELIKDRDKKAADKAAKDAEEAEEKKFLDRLAKHKSKNVPPDDSPVSLRTNISSKE